MYNPGCQGAYIYIYVYVCIDRYICVYIYIYIQGPFQGIIDRDV